MSQPTTVTRWTTGEIVAAILAFPAAIAALVVIQGALRKRYRRHTQNITTQDVELGTLSSVQMESDPNSRPAPQQGVNQLVGTRYLARNILRRSSVRGHPLEEHDRSVLRLRHHLASGVSSSFTTVHEQRTRESHESIGTSLEDFGTLTWLAIRTKEAKDQIAREKTEWQEVRLSRNPPVAASSSRLELIEG